MSAPEQAKKETKKQFNEVDYDMSSHTFWSQADVDTFRGSLASSYQILPAEITHKFEAIEDVNDDDRRNCVYLVYYMAREIALGGQTVTSDKPRRIFRIKMPLSEELKKKAAARINGNSPFNAAPALRPISLLPTSQQQPAHQYVSIIRPKRIGPPTPN